jgi:FkbM family methyltransferase
MDIRVAVLPGAPPAGEVPPLYFRPRSAGDIAVLHQIFLRKEYEIDGFGPLAVSLQHYYEGLLARGCKPLIVDLGANIGASAVALHRRWPRSAMVAVEPQPDNFHLLQMNTRSIDCTAVCAAVAGKTGSIQMFNPQLGVESLAYRVIDEQDRSAGSQAAAEAFTARAVTVSELLDEHADSAPFILKIDIEGYEKRLFEGDCPWTTAFALIVIETHDQMLPFQGISSSVLRQICKGNFDLTSRGENLFFWNTDLLKHFA